MDSVVFRIASVFMNLKYNMQTNGTNPQNSKNKLKVLRAIRGYNNMI